MTTRFCAKSRSPTLGGYSWPVPGRVWFTTVDEKSTADADFNDFDQATVAVAGKLYGDGGNVQMTARASMGPGRYRCAARLQAGAGSPHPTLRPSASPDFTIRRIPGAVRQARASGLHVLHLYDKLTLLTYSVLSHPFPGDLFCAPRLIIIPQVL